MAGRKYRAMSNGAAAYDLRTQRGAEAPERPKLPEEAPRPQRKVHIKAKTMVSPFAVVGMAAAGFLLVLVIFGYVRLYEATAEVGRLSDQLASVEQSNDALRAQYEGKIDLAAIEERAIHELGMSQPTSSQNVYLDLSGDDRAVIVQEEGPGFFEMLFEACTDGVQDLTAYLSHKPAGG